MEEGKHTFAGFLDKNTNSRKVIGLCSFASRINLEENTDHHDIWCRITPTLSFLASTSTFGDPTVGTVTTVDIGITLASCRHCK
jgi:hypothetical protein